VQSVLVSAPAKINLGLAVGPPRADGFHPLHTVYQAVDLCDELRATHSDDAGITLTISAGTSDGGSARRAQPSRWRQRRRCASTPGPSTASR
jgi:4-diphosphocytidyl-2-C-methyl-D-erythritol kinase